jgi:hypothetical protein
MRSLRKQEGAEQREAEGKTRPALKYTRMIRTLAAGLEDQETLQLPTSDIDSVLDTSS